MKSRNVFQCVLTLVLIGVTVACGNSSKPAATLQSIAITPDPGATTIPLGATQQFKATGTFSDNTTQDITSSVTWASSDTTVITIGTGGAARSSPAVPGLAKALKLGTSTISASSGSVKSPASNPTTVGPAVLSSIAVTPNPASVVIGSTVQFTAMATLTDGSTNDITATATWNSSNTAVATITSPGGLATGVAKGSSNITASAPGANGTVASPVSVLTVTPVLLSIDVEPTAPSVALGNTQQFTATGHYNDGSTLDLTNSATWASSLISVATIDSIGLATTHAQGATNITATSGSVVSNTAVLTVTAPVLKSITVTPANPSIQVGAKQQFTATGTLTDGTTKDLTATATWTSSNTAVATITNPGGKATGIAAGMTTITATDPVSTISGSTTLTVGSANHNGKLNGHYTFTFQSPGALAGTEAFVAGAFTADGAGNITNGIIDVNPGGGGTFTSGLTFTGTYNVGSDNRGTYKSGGYKPWVYLHRRYCRREQQSHLRDGVGPQWAGLRPD